MNMHINVADELPKQIRKEINGSQRSLIVAQRRKKCLVGPRPVVYTIVLLFVYCASFRRSASVSPSDRRKFVDLGFFGGPCIPTRYDIEKRFYCYLAIGSQYLTEN